YGFEKISSKNNILNIYKNRNVLKTGMLVNEKKAKSFRLNNTDNLGNQNKLLSLVADTSINKKLFSNIPIVLLGTTANYISRQGILKFNNLQTMPKYINVQMTIPKNRQAYLSLFKINGNLSQISVYKNNRFIESYNPNLMGQYINLGFYKKQTTINVRVNILGTGNVTMMKPALITLNSRIFKKNLSQAHAKGVNLNYGKRTITGNIYAKGKQALMLTIPYDPGWKAYVNGKLIKVTSVDNIFCLIPLTKGTNTIKIIYTPSGFIVGMWLTIIGIIVFIVVIIREKLRAMIIPM
ncbi:YfhO family protein, partial [Liquorilactobacillus sp.]|uniref:YfhO family protein n=1 Tax=Liquorilactobacillus sp. TaxID=2767923 RepID=UPI0039EA86BD